ncbi:cytochrome P450 71A8-like [Olea europaea subsp. europaea]|uniref:Cytochrome P450 71A8-like n=2 Tax=Olea europaea subsp. europaea TaxID=158383 RepID=A0A8S0R5V6_OLEEU|nr:cytochrome P450 71A8-like [Olea europaea subsp. europaea]
MFSFHQEIDLSYVMITLFFLWFLKKFLYRPAAKKNLPPSPPKLPILGNLHQLSALTHRSLQSLAKKYGPLMLLHFGNKPTLIVSSADAAKEIMKTRDLIFANKPDSSVTRLLMYNGKDVAVAPYGEYWRQLKSIFVLQLLSNKRVQSFHSIREEETALLVKKVSGLVSETSSPVNLSEMFVSLANDVVCRAALGRKYSEEGNGKKFLYLLREISELVAKVSVGEFIPCLSWIERVSGFKARVNKAAKEFDEFLEEIIQGSLDAGQDLSGKENGSSENFLDILTAIYKENSIGISIDKDSIKGILVDVFVGGTDTTSTVLEWAMTELIRHPKIMNRLQNEVRGILNGKQNITDADLEKMYFLKAIIKETLRYHSSIPFLTRIASQDVQIMGYDIAAGTMIITNNWAMGRDPESWEEPEKFQPERFLNYPIDFRGLDFQLLPFGAGRRRCPGISFAMATIEFALANLVQKFDWKLPNGDKGENLDITEHPGITIHRKKPLLAVATQYCF